MNNVALVYPYCGLNRHIQPPRVVVQRADAAAEEFPGASVSVRSFCDRDGEYTIEPLDGWAVNVRRYGAPNVHYHFTPSGEFVKTIFGPAD